MSQLSPGGREKRIMENRNAIIKQQYCEFHKTAHKLRVEIKNFLCITQIMDIAYKSFVLCDSIQQMMTNYSEFTTQQQQQWP